MKKKEEFNHHLHMKLLSKSFHRKGDDLTSVLLGHAVSTATDLYIEINNKTCNYTTYDTGKGYNNYKSGCKIQVADVPIVWGYCPYCGNKIKRDF